MRACMSVKRDLKCGLNNSDGKLVTHIESRREKERGKGGEEDEGGGRGSGRRNSIGEEEIYRLLDRKNVYEKGLARRRKERMR